MKNAATHAKKFATLFKKISQTYKPDLPDPLDPVTQLIVGFLEWESTAADAVAAHERLLEDMVDNNEVRVSHVSEIVKRIDPKYPRATERAARMRDALQEVFKREHATDMGSLEGMTKKQARQYLESLPGMVPYVSAQVLLLCLGAHAMPVDDTLLELLKSQGAADEDATVEEASAFLDRQVKAGEGVEAHMLLRAWVDAGPRRVKIASSRKKSAKKRTSKKKSSTSASSNRTTKRSTKKAAKKK